MRVLAIAAFLIAVPAYADRTGAELVAATAGTLEHGRVPGSFVLGTDAVPGRFSSGEAIARQPIKLPYRIDVTWRRLGPEAGRSMHVTVADGVVLFKSGKVALYAFDEAKFAADGWRRLPGFDTHAEHAISVRQDAGELVVLIDGKEVTRFAHRTARTEFRPGVGMKGAPGHRTAIYVRALSLTAL